MDRRLFIFASFLATACSVPGGSPPAPTATAPGGVTRSDVIATADRYLLFKWKPTAANILHGNDSAGIHVDTPDSTYQVPKSFPGWWQPGVQNQSMPYKWGGFDTPESFLAGLKAGRPAGDVYTQEKRRLLDAAVSKETIGIDCSGFISRCWALPRAYSTRTLPSLCEPLADYNDLRPGDILNLHNAHALLFAGWDTPDHTRLLAYETGCPPTWKVFRHSITVKMLKDQGFQPLRYRGIKD